MMWEEERGWEGKDTCINASFYLGAKANVVREGRAVEGMENCSLGQERANDMFGFG